jgi:hypothetical protein
LTVLLLLPMLMVPALLVKTETVLAGALVARVGLLLLKLMVGVAPVRVTSPPSVAVPVPVTLKLAALM